MLKYNNKMKKFPLIKNSNILAVFAHPDDEAFGPSGLIAYLSEKNNLYLLVVTDGSAGKNSSKSKLSLSEIRKTEVKKSAKILGVKEIYFFNYGDGCLNNNLYKEIRGKIEKIIKKFKIDYLLTYEPRGISGHLDHIFVSLVCSHIAQKNKKIKELFYFCLSKKQRKIIGGDYFIFFPPGYSQKEIEYYFDYKAYWNKKVKAIKTHLSQKHDAIQILKNLKKEEKKEYYFSFKKIKKALKI